MEIQNKCIGRKSENVVPNQMQLHIQKKKKKVITYTILILGRIFK